MRIEDSKLNDRFLCYQCVEDNYLSAEIKRNGRSNRCNYCKGKRRSYTIEQLASRVEQAFEQHFESTNDQPTEEQYWRQHADKESNYWWYREGESLPFLLEDVGGIPNGAALDIQEVLEKRHYDFDTDFQEQPYSSEALYEMSGVSDQGWQNDWNEFERIVKTESRFFSKKVYNYLSEIFNGIEKFTSYKGQPLVSTAGPEQKLTRVFRARVFQDQAEMLSALKHPDQQLGTPPAKFARGGRMNAPGVAVFYGATSRELALAEVRPPVGSRSVIANFEIIRPLRLLDLTALRNARAEGSIFDPNYAPLREKALFLNRLAERIALPIMPAQENSDYLPTQVIADFLSEAMDQPYDGIIFASTQSRAHGANVVLFHRSARVSDIEIREGSEITAHSSVYEEAEGEYESYNVVVQQPDKPHKKKVIRDHIYHPELGFLPSPRWPIAVDGREMTLKILENDLEIVEVQSVEFEKKELHYHRSVIRKVGRPKPPLDDLDLFNDF
jgi:hypothetical protein